MAAGVVIGVYAAHNPAVYGRVADIVLLILGGGAAGQSLRGGSSSGSLFTQNTIGAAFLGGLLGWLAVWGAHGALPLDDILHLILPTDSSHSHP